jgi:hypothetical protein
MIDLENPSFFLQDDLFQLIKSELSYQLQEVGYGQLVGKRLLTN